MCTNRVRNVVTLESVEANFVINSQRTQFQAQEASMNLLRKSGPLGHFQTKISARKCNVLTEEKLDEIGDSFVHISQK
jgi:hypothetical protein